MRQSKICKYGYRWIHRPDHPDANRDGFISEHRLVLSESLGRRLTKYEVVHHINGDRLDNRLENLQLMTRSEHIGLHHRKEKPEGLTKEILQDMLDTLTMEEVSVHFGVDQTVVKRWREELGVLEFNRKNKFRKDLGKTKEEISDLLKDNAVHKVAEMLGVCAEKLERYMKENGIKREPYSHCNKTKGYSKRIKSGF
jgi:hypothetical protein